MHNGRSIVAPTNSTLQHQSARPPKHSNPFFRQSVGARIPSTTKTNQLPHDHLSQIHLISQFYVFRKNSQYFEAAGRIWNANCAQARENSRRNGTSYCLTSPSYQSFTRTGWSIQQNTTVASHQSPEQRWMTQRHFNHFLDLCELFATTANVVIAKSVQSFYFYL